MKYFDNILWYLLTAFIGFLVCFLFFNNKYLLYKTPQKISSKNDILKSPTNNEMIKEAENTIQILKYHENLSGKLKEIEFRLGRIENKLQSLINAGQSTNNNLLNPPTHFSEEINGGSTKLESFSDNDSGNLMSPSWIGELPPNVQDNVNQIFQEHAQMVSEKLSFLSNEDKVDAQIIENIMEESDKILREKLRRVLSDEEFQSFLDSLPEPTPDSYSEDINGDRPEFGGALNDDSGNLMLPSWIGKLPPNVQDNVNQIFLEHTEMVTEKLSFLSDEDKEDNQTIENIIEEYDKILMEKLRRVLSDEEFQSFLDSLPEPTPDLEKP